jgi:GGDEF domain-containing protein
VPEGTSGMLRLLAGQAAVAIEHAALRARMETLTLTDELTGVATRRVFEDELPRELARARRNDYPTSIAMLDLDHLGAFNMQRGEREGDRLIKEAAALWRGELREVDVMARFEGGTFAVILPNCGLGRRRALGHRGAVRAPAGPLPGGARRRQGGRSQRHVRGRVARPLRAVRRCCGGRRRGGRAWHAAPMARPVVIRVLATIVFLSLLLPWLSGTDDGEPLIVIGGDIEWWFTLAMVVLSLNAMLLAHSAIAAGVLGCAMLGLTARLLQRGELYSAPDPAWGAYVALAAEAVLVVIGVIGAIAARRHRTPAEE